MKVWIAGALAALSLALACVSPARAVPNDVVPGSLSISGCPSPTTTPCFVPGPYQYTPLANGQYGLPVSTATALTIPTGATYATVCAETEPVRYTTTGTTPSSTIGIPLIASSTTTQCVGLYGSVVLGAFQAFGAGATIDVEYFK